MLSCREIFRRYRGEPVVRAAIAAGCHYVDVSGEQLFIKHVHDTFAQEAERAQVSVLSAATDDAVPGDLLAHLTALKVGPVEELTIAHLMTVGQPSRGTLRSVLAIAEGLAEGPLQYADGRFQTGVDPKATSIAFPGLPGPTPVVSAALPELVTVPRHVRAHRIEGVGDAATLDAFASVTPELVDSLPTDGPPDDVRSQGAFAIVVQATGTDGHQATGIVQGVDVYGTTAVIAAETARRLASGTAPAGVLAPAQAYDPEEFLTFLAPHQLTWSVT